MTLEQLIEQKSFLTMVGTHVVSVDDLLAWAIEQMEQGNLLPGDTKEPTVADTCAECKYGDDPCGFNEAFVSEHYGQADVNGKFCIRCGHAPACHRKENTNER